MSKEQIILGIDPGTIVTGYGIIRSKDRSWEPVDFGAIRPPRTSNPGERYLVIFEAIEHLIEEFKPDAIAVETQFVYKNVQVALKLGMARGSVLIAAARNKIAVFEYAPTKAKLAVVGHGSASKHQVQQMVQMQLKLAKPPEPHDAADALALAICHAYYKDMKCLSTSAVN
ncbi:MAG: crossover junction endodeoxyribonuclease RuvC [Rhabdochlamydiaceae bacterium]|jgi:crossover junction endodeoxyribonuclease RuvC